MPRSMSFEEAKHRYIHRFTMEHVPRWALRRPCDDGGTETRYYAPQYRSDREWYEHMIFPGEEGYSGMAGECVSRGQTWPLGRWLRQPYDELPVRTRLISRV